MQIKALHFDVFGTVVDWRESIAREAAEVLGGRGIACDWHAFADAWRSKYQPAMEEIRSGRRELDQNSTCCTAKTSLPFSTILGCLASADTEIDHLNFAWHRLDPWPDVAAGLARLRRDYTLVTLSNGNVSLMVNLARHGGLAVGCGSRRRSRPGLQAGTPGLSEECRAPWLGTRSVPDGCGPQWRSCCGKR